MKKIGIVDFSLGNLFSVQHAIHKVGGDSEFVQAPEKLKEMDALVLPGVGAFGEAMAELHKTGMDVAIKDWVKSGKPLLGVCLGLQLLMNESEEFGPHKGLGLVNGKVKKFPSELNGRNIRVPHMGWNSIHFSQPGHRALDGIPQEIDMYFVHSYYVELEDRLAELTWTEYNGIRYTSSIATENVWAFQFHPEKSSQFGLRIYQNWLKQFI